MARYILIDNNSGYIFGDTADLPGFDGSGGSPIDAARTLDASIGVHGRDYELLYRNPADTGTGYDVYRADIDGSEAVPVVQDGQDPDTIAAVVQHCEHVGFVRCRDAAAEG
jgi:hypothetical protein